MEPAMLKSERKALRYMLMGGTPVPPDFADVQKLGDVGIIEQLSTILHKSSISGDVPQIVKTGGSRSGSK
jgi:hypothetical protein